MSYTHDTEKQQLTIDDGDICSNEPLTTLIGARAQL